MRRYNLVKTLLYKTLLCFALFFRVLYSCFVFLPAIGLFAFFTVMGWGAITYRRLPIYGQHPDPIATGIPEVIELTEVLGLLSWMLNIPLVCVLIILRIFRITELSKADRLDINLFFFCLLVWILTKTFIPETMAWVLD